MMYLYELQRNYFFMSIHAEKLGYNSKFALRLIKFIILDNHSFDMMESLRWIAEVYPRELI